MPILDQLFAAAFSGVAAVAALGPRLAVAQSEAVNRRALPDYRCVVEQVVTAGQHNMTPPQQVDRRLIGARFSVERRTGLMSGALKNSYITRPEVIDFGSQDNSFKAVTTMRIEQGVGRGTNTYVLVVNEFDRSARKPFVFLENAEVYFGTCVHQL